MIDYASIDNELKRWAALKNYVVQTCYRDEEVRSFVIWSADHSRRVQIGITKIEDYQVELAVFDGGKKRKRLSASKRDFVKLLDEAEALAISWLG